MDMEAEFRIHKEAFDDFLDLLCDVVSNQKNYEFISRYEYRRSLTNVSV